MRWSRGRAAQRSRRALYRRLVRGLPLQVFHLSAAAPEYTGEKSSRVPFYRGRNTLMVELPPGVTGRLRIDPGEMPGAYRLYHIEIRGF